MNHQAIQLLTEIRDEFEDQNMKIVISGCIGPRSDGYRPGILMDEDEAEHYHRRQIETVAETEADMVTALTMTYTEEAIGIVRAAQSVGLPVVISFTLETDGILPCGQSLQAAIEQVDAATKDGTAYYMINCAHPTHFEEVIESDSPWVSRIRGLRANASRLSHAELNEADELDDGNPLELASQYFALHKKMDNLNVMGGCCGTDHRHIEEICKACLPKIIA